MKKSYLLLLGFILSVPIYAQNLGAPKITKPTKFNLVHVNNNSINGYAALNQLLSENDTTVILFKRYSFATIYFLNAWFHSSAENDSVLLSYLEKTSFVKNEYDYENRDDLDKFKKWRNSIPDSMRKLIRFESFSYHQELESQFGILSHFHFLHYLTRNMKGLDIDAQSNIDAIQAVIDYDTYNANNYNNGEDHEDDNTTYDAYDRTPSFQEEVTLFEIFKNIEKFDTAINGQIGNSEKIFWNQYVQKMINIRNLFINPYFRFEDAGDKSSSMNNLFSQLDLLVKQKNRNYFYLVDENGFYDFKNDELAATGLSFRTILNDLYPTVPVNRYLFYSQTDTTLKDSALNAYLFGDHPTDTMNICKILVANDTSNLENSDYLVDTAVEVNEEENSFISKPFSFRSIGFEANYSRWFNDIKSFKDVVDPANQIAHISTIGGSFTFQKGPTITGARRYKSHATRYRVNYNQLYAKESVDWLWANQLGFSIENKLFETKFLSIYFGQNLSYYNFTLSKTIASPFDQFILNPSEMYQVNNSGFMYGVGLNMKIAVSALYMRLEGGYQYDMSDSRWAYKGNLINSVGTMSTTGGYFDLGIGLNMGY